MKKRLAALVGCAALVVGGFGVMSASPAAADGIACKQVLDAANPSQLTLTTGAICDTTYGLAQLTSPEIAEAACETAMSTAAVPADIAEEACAAAVEDS